MTVFGHDPLEATLLLVGIVSALAVGWAVWRAKSAEVAAAAVDTWRELAQGYQEKLEQRERDLADLKVQHAAETATLESQIDELRRQVEQLREQVRSSDQTAVLELIRAHEVTASERHVKTLDVLVEIRDELRKAA